MKKLLKLADNTMGTVSAEAAITSTAVIILFSVFISVAGYCITAARVKEAASHKAMNSALAMYALDITVPFSINGVSDFDDRSNLAKNLLFYSMVSDKLVTVTARYKYPSIFGDIKTEVSAVCTLWEGDSIEKNTDKHVWDLPPNERGMEIEKVFGGNLPEFFPILDFFDPVTGQAISIVSIDTTLEVYKSGMEIERVITEKAEKLINFKSGKSGDKEIHANQITNKKLLVIIPENQLSVTQESYLDDAIFYTLSKGISAEVKRYQSVGE